MMQYINNKFNISFGARFISSATIEKKVQNYNNYLPHKVSFVELSPKNPKDRSVMGDVASDWYKKDLFACAIYDDLIEDFEYDCSSNKYFAIINEYKSENINKDNILGIIELGHGYKNTSRLTHINYLQVNPMFINSKEGSFSKNPDFKNIGLGLIQSVYNLFKGNDITVTPTDDAERFYSKIGFECTDNFLFKLNDLKFFKYMNDKFQSRQINLIKYKIGINFKKIFKIL